MAADTENAITLGRVCAGPFPARIGIGGFQDFVEQSCGDRSRAGDGRARFRAVAARAITMAVLKVQAALGAWSNVMLPWHRTVQYTGGRLHG
jgi:hypothetical protein